MGRLKPSARAASQETCRHTSPIRCAGRAVKRIPVVATDVHPVGGIVRSAAVGTPPDIRLMQFRESACDLGVLSDADTCFASLTVRAPPSWS